MNSTDAKMFELMNALKALGVIRFDVQFCEAIGLQKQNLRNIKSGRNHFTVSHIKNALDEFKVNACWVFGQSTEMFLRSQNRLQIDKKRSANNFISA
jgi:plasmid maintenance system antidote protein VapI